MKIKKLAIVLNPTKNAVQEDLKRVLVFAKKHNIETVISEAYPTPKTFLNGFDMCCVLGGDGTILGVVESALLNQTPIVGINRGKLGYLASYQPDDIEHIFKEIFVEQNFRLVNRSIVETNLENTIFYSLNDVVIKAWDNFKMTHLKVSCNDGELINEFHSDGLIISTASGSTAYNLSSGGPLIYSDANVYAITPISPHTLSNRSLVLPENLKIIVQNETPGVKLGISFDGRPPIHFSTTLKCGLSNKKISLIQPTDLSEFQILRTKLNWIPTKITI